MRLRRERVRETLQLRQTSSGWCCRSGLRGSVEETGKAEDFQNLSSLRGLHHCGACECPQTAANVTPRGLRRGNKQMSGRGFISVEKDRRCELCGTIAECRPYGPKGEHVCFDCGMKDSEA